MPTTSDRWPAFWRQIDAAIHPGAQQAFERAYALVEHAAICVGHRGQLYLQRQQDTVSWLIGPDTPFGDLEPEVEAALKSVAHVSVPEYYAPGVRTGHLTHVGRCCWDVQFSQHQRLHLIQQVQETGRLGS